ncbi:MAG: LptF/LptG family permease [Candidatus Sericytochromatia bacterium]|nr:LptF/LptG family permease [Candidatus Sericytochromatia bacterium]
MRSQPPRVLRLLDRSVVGELVVPFAFGLGAFTGILLATTVMFHLVTLMVRHGLPAWLVLEVLLLRLPETAGYTFPMATLLAALLAYSRLAGDGELTAWRAVGVGVSRLVAPGLAFAAVVAAATLLLNEVISPAASWEARRLLLEATQQRHVPVTREHLFYPEREGGVLRRFFYARRWDGRRMQDVVVQEFEEGRLVRLVQAAEAEPLDDGWLFRGGVMHQVDARGEFRWTVRFAAQRVVLGSDMLAMAQEGRAPQEMTVRELREHVQRLTRTGASAREVAELEVLAGQRISVPCAALVFVLLGAGMGIRPQRASASVGLGVSVLVLFVYYVLMFTGMAFGQTGALAPVVAAWLPNVACGVLALWRLRALSRA